MAEKPSDKQASFRELPDDVAIETQAIRAGLLPTEHQSNGEPIFTTSSFVFENAAQAAARFAGDEPGFIYSRFSNPTVDAFEKRLAALEGGERCIATASGMSAIMATVVALMEQGDEIVCSRSVFGTTNVLFEKYLPRMGIKAHFVGINDYAGWEQAVSDKTKVLFLETPSNPLNEIADIQKIAAIAHGVGARLVVDNCFCTPALQLPLALGADIIIHSATKFLDGQGRCMGGAVVGKEADLADIAAFLRSAGPAMSPFNAWVFLKGLELLNLRMKAHSENALAVAQWLAQHPAVETVFYCGLPDHPDHELASRQQRGFGGVLSFRVRGGREAAWSVIDATRFLSITANLGDTKTTITHPATTTHGRISPEAKIEAGITENLVRVAVGLENVDDIIRDLALGLDKLR